MQFLNSPGLRPSAHLSYLLILPISPDLWREHVHITAKGTGKKEFVILCIRVPTRIL